VPHHTPRGPQSGRRALGKLSREKVRLIGEHRRLQTRNLATAVSVSDSATAASELERDARQEKMCEHGFSGEQRLIEKSGRARAESARLKVAAFVEQEQSLVQIQEPRPHQILFPRKHFARFREPSERLNCFSLLAVSDRLVCQRFCAS